MAEYPGNCCTDEMSDSQQNVSDVAIHYTCMQSWLYQIGSEILIFNFGYV